MACPKYPSLRSSLHVASRLEGGGGKGAGTAAVYGEGAVVSVVTNNKWDKITNLVSYLCLPCTSVVMHILDDWE